MSAQKSLDGVSEQGNGARRAASAPSERHGPGQTQNPDCSPANHAPARGVVVELFWPLPRDAKLGSRQLRLEWCPFANADHTVAYTAIERNVWQRRCLTCR